MPIVSAKLVDGEKAVYSSFNNLREDLLANHTHDGTAGAQIDHANLTESGVISGKKCTHTQLDTHIVEAGGSFDDSPGYDRGVHGLNAALYVAGSLPDQIAIEYGSLTLESHNDGGGTPTYWAEGDAVFDTPFTSIKSVTFSLLHTGALGATVAHFLYMSALSTAGITVRSEGMGAYDNFFQAVNGTAVYYIAIGTIAK